MDAAPKEITFQAREEPDGGYSARAIGFSIFTQGDDWGHLKYMIRDAVLCHFDEGKGPETVRIEVVREEVISV